MDLATFDFLALGSVVTIILAAVVLAFHNWLKSLPLAAWRWLVTRMAVSVTIAQDDAAFQLVEEFVQAHPSSKRARSFKLQYDPRTRHFEPVPAGGTIWLWHRGPVWIRHGQTQQQLQEKPDNTLAALTAAVAQQNQYTITMLDLGHRRLHAFMEHMVRSAAAKDDPKDARLYVYTWNGWWHCGYPKRKRSMDTVYLPAAQKAGLLAKAEKFLRDEAWYISRGIPYRLSIELEGPPGTGKTTLATALAGHLGKPIYIFNLGSITNDNELMRAFQYMAHDGIALIEDIDSFPCARRRANVEEEVRSEMSDAEIKQKTEEFLDKLHKDLTAEVSPRSNFTGGIFASGAGSPPTLEASAEKKETVTQSGLLNAIDGVAAVEGRILIMTTNDHARLDPALVRSSRVDKHLVIGPLGPDEVAAMFSCFFPATPCHLPAVRAYAEARRRTAAHWQSLFVDHNEDVQRLMDEVIAPRAPGRQPGGPA